MILLRKKTKSEYDRLLIEALHILYYAQSYIEINDHYRIVANPAFLDYSIYDKSFLSAGDVAAFDWLTDRFKLYVLVNEHYLAFIDDCEKYISGGAPMPLLDDLDLLFSDRKTAIDKYPIGLLDSTSGAKLWTLDKDIVRYSEIIKDRIESSKMHLYVVPPTSKPQPRLFLESDNPRNSFERHRGVVIVINTHIILRSL